MSQSIRFNQKKHLIIQDNNYKLHPKKIDYGFDKIFMTVKRKLVAFI